MRELRKRLEKIVPENSKVKVDTIVEAAEKGQYDRACTRYFEVRDFAQSLVSA